MRTRDTLPRSTALTRSPRTHRHWHRPTDLRSLLHLEPTLPTTQLEFVSTGLSGDISGYRETTTTAAAARTATNSTALDRKPADYVGSFVRGKSSYFPFKPGGLADVVLDDDDGAQGGAALEQGLEKAFEKGYGAFRSAFLVRSCPLTGLCIPAGGIRTIPPGFTRGLDFGPVADDPTSSALLEEEEEVEVKPIYRPMLELSNEGRARAVTVRLVRRPR